jgi:hypothetical protein
MKVRFNSMSFGKDTAKASDGSVIRLQKKAVSKTGLTSFAFLVSLVDTAGVDPSLLQWTNVTPSGVVVAEPQIRRAVEMWFTADEAEKINSKFSQVQASGGVLFFEFSPSANNGIRLSELTQGLADPSLFYQTMTLSPDRYQDRVFSVGSAPAIQGLD